MKSFTRRLPLLVLGAMTCALLADLGPEILRNPGFEEDADNDGLPDHWSTADDRIALQETVFMGQNLAITSKPPTYVLATQDVRLEAGKDYTLTVRAKGHGGGIGGALILHGEDRSHREMPLLWNLALTQDFEEYTRVFTAPNPVARLYLYNIAKSKGTVTYDHVSLRQGVPEHALITQFSLKEIDQPSGPPAEFPRLRYGTPLAGGPIRTFMTIRHFRCLRQVIELEQRLDLDIDVVHTGYYGKQCASNTARRAMKRLKEHAYEVYVVPSRLPQALADDIRDRVAEGAGLVLVEGFGRADEILDPRTLAPAPADHPLRLVFPMEHMPEDILDDIHIGTLGGGRVTRLIFPLDKARVWGLMPRESSLDAWRERQFEFWEWWEALLAEAVRWAARGPATVTMKTLTQEAPDVVSIHATGTDLTDLRVVLRGAREIRFAGEPCLRTEEQRLALDENGTVSVRIPPNLGAGTVFAEVSALNQDGNVLSWKTFALERSTMATLTKLAVDKAVRAPADPVNGRVEIDARAQTDAVLEGRLIDAHGRVLDRVNAALRLVPGRHTAEITLTMREPLVVFHRLEARLLVDGIEQDRLWTAVTVPQLGPETAAADFTVIPWSPGMSHPLIVQRYTDIMTEIGQNGDFPGTGYLAAERGLPVAGYMNGMSTYFREGHQRDDGSRAVCLHDPDVRRKIAERAAESGTVSRDFGLFAVGITDEAFLTSRHHRNEVCFSDHTQNAYRQWLREQYGSLRNVNAQWSTTFTDWTQVRGVRTEDIRDKDNFAPFVDFRTFMTDTWIATCGHAVGAYQAANPGVPVGHTNTFGANPFNGNDYWKLARHTGFAWGQEYSEAIKSSAHKAVFDLWRSFRGADFFNYGWIGYNHRREAAQYEPWWLALHGSKGVSYYATNSVDPVRGVSWSLVHPTLSKTPFSLAVQEALADLRAGCGKLFMTFQRERPDIGLLWSHPSMLVAWCESSHDLPVPDERPGCDSYGSYFRSALDFRQHVNELQMDYRYVAPEQLLQDSDPPLPRLLFLPFTVAMRAELVDRLERFVREGGVLVGDLRCLRTDHHGTPFANSDPLNRLFGLKRTHPAAVDYAPSTVTFRHEAHGIGLPGRTADVLGRERLTPGATAGALAVHADGTPALTVKALGRGLAVYFNFRLPEYSVITRDLVAQCLHAAGIERPVTVVSRDTDQPPRCYERNTFAHGNALLHAFIRDFRRCEDRDPVTITFGAAAHVHDVRKRTYLGLTDHVDCVIPPGNTALFACLPYRVTELNLDTAVHDGALSVAAAVQTEGDPPGLHVIHVRILRPDGTATATYPRNLTAPAARLTHRVPLALNRPSGTWTVSVRDVLSGTLAETTVTLE